MLPVPPLLTVIAVMAGLLLIVSTTEPGRMFISSMGSPERTAT